MKILLLTHNPICTQNNMGKTFLSLFSEFRKEDLCQLYIHSAISDVDACNSYFQITDKMILKSGILGCPGREISSEMIAEQIAMTMRGESAPTKWRGMNPVSCLARDMMWKCSRWYSKKLRAWLDREAPTVIFLAPGYAKFIYDIALKISKERNLPIVTYVCDDYYFVKTPSTCFGKIHLHLLRKKTEQLMKKTHRLVVISEELKKTYASHFGVKTNVVMTGAEITPFVSSEEKGEIRKVSYFGNLSLGRCQPLAEIGREIDSLNEKHHLNVAFHIYTADEEKLSAFDDIRCVKRCGFVSGEVFKKAFLSSDMLVHVESFFSENVDIVKHSVSTKIADCLASGIPLFAYGPAQIASMQHLLRNHCAFLATKPEALRASLEEAFLQPKKITEITARAKETSQEYHNKQKNSIQLKTVFSEVEGTVYE